MKKKETTLEIGKRMYRKHADSNRKLKKAAGKKLLESEEEIVYVKVHRRKPLTTIRLAGRAVSLAIKEGDMPPASSLTCKYCGAQAKHYHHHSYKAVDWLNVTPLCFECHSNIHDGHWWKRE